MHTQEHPLVVVFYAALVSVLVTSGYLLYDFVLPQSREWLSVGLVGILAYMAHYCTVRAYQLAPIAQVSAVAYTAVIYALLLSYLFLDEALDWAKLLGMGLVLLGVLLNAFYKLNRVA
jgi:drug/metabolite transporter (DMT)-like permease